MDDRIRDILELIGIAAALAGGVGGTLLVIWKFGKNIYTAVVLAHRMGNTFGRRGDETLSAFILRAEAEIIEGRARRSIIETTIGLGIYICDTEGRCVFANDWIIENYGVDSADISGHGWLAGVVNSDRAEVHQHWQYCVDNRVPYNAAYTIRNPRTGKEIKAATTATEVMDATGTVAFWIGTVTEIEIENETT